jgi:hypothetical protein
VHTSERLSSYRRCRRRHAILAATYGDPAATCDSGGHLWRSGVWSPRRRLDRLLSEPRWLARSWSVPPGGRRGAAVGADRWAADDRDGHLCSADGAQAAPSLEVSDAGGGGVGLDPSARPGRRIEPAPPWRADGRRGAADLPRTRCFSCGTQPTTSWPNRRYPLPRSRSWIPVRHPTACEFVTPARSESSANLV